MQREPPEPMTLPDGPEPYYSFGTCLCLDETHLEQLGFTELPPAGTAFMIEAKAIVRRSSTEDPDADGDVDRASLELQITHLGLEEQSDKMRAATRSAKAAKLYGGDTDKDAA